MKVKCSCCGVVLREYIENQQYPDGAYRVINRQHGRKHEDVIYVKDGRLMVDSMPCPAEIPTRSAA